MEQAIKKAIEGGWNPTEYESVQNPDHCIYCDYFIFLDPLFWQALGKAEGWEEHRQFESRMTRCICSKCGDTRVTIQWTEWMYHWHSFIDHLSEGKPIDDFFNNLLTNK